jgi:hypothetical protein
VTTAVRTSATKGAEADSARKTALALCGSVIDHPDYFVGAGADTPVTLSALLEISTAIANIGAAVVPFPVLERYSERIALGYAAPRVLESTIIVYRRRPHQAPVGRDLAAGPGGEDGSLVIAARSLVALHDWPFLLGPRFYAGFGNGLLLGYLMYTSGLMPRWMTRLGLIGVPPANAGGTPVRLTGCLEKTCF